MGCTGKNLPLSRCYVLNISSITSKFSIVVMFIIVDLEAGLHIQRVGIPYFNQQNAQIKKMHGMNYIKFSVWVCLRSVA
jgi:arabinogalactan endo-1,4-beta-galactosidase